MQVTESRSYVNIAKAVSPVLGIRLTATQFFKNFESKNDNKIEIDFKDVEFISRSFAHEYLKQKQISSKKIQEINIPPNVKQMIEIVQRSK